MNSEDLNSIDPAHFSLAPFPLKELLEGSLYYPGSGIDGTPIRNWSLGVNSFVYADLSFSKEAYEKALSIAPIRGYHIFAQRSLERAELVSASYKIETPSVLTSAQYSDAMALNGANTSNSFAIWTIFERDAGEDESYGPARFSLLHIRGEGVATYAGLYLANRCLPKVLAFIRPGLGFGGNYATFEVALLEVMLRNPSGLPDQLLWEHSAGETPTLPASWADFYRHKLQGPLARDQEPGFVVSLFGQTS